MFGWFSGGFSHVDPRKVTLFVWELKTAQLSNFRGWLTLFEGSGRSGFGRTHLESLLPEEGKA